MPQRVRVFIWQLTHGRLHTRSRTTKWSGGTTICHHCGIQEETLVWMHLISVEIRSNFFGMEVHWIIFNLSHDWMNLWAYACYLLWFWRNKSILDSNFIYPRNPWDDIKLSCQRYLHNPGDIHSLKPQIKVEMLILKKWKPPQVGSFCVNIDGPVKDQFALAGCGGLIRDHQGRWMGSFAKKTGCASPIVA